MLGLCSQGRLVVTDHDLIENSNLNRQFLFREKHIRQAKSTCACAVIIQMNPDLKGRVTSLLDKVSTQTQHIFDESFFQQMSCVTNGLDNVPARKFIDTKCVNARVPLIDSGTLGPMGHVQPVIPFYSESYGSQEDPANDDSIPVCTIKLFPEEPLHCIEWAMELFESLFTKIPAAANKLLDAFSLGDDI